MIVMTLLVALLASTLFISNAMKEEYNKIIDSYPDIVVTNQKASRETTIQENKADKILLIKGVSSVVPRVWGEYSFLNADKKFMIFGVDEFEEYANPLLNANTKIEENSMLLSKNAKKILQESYYSKYFNFIKSDGSLKKVMISGVLKGDYAKEKSSIILMKSSLAKEIFNYEEGEATDFGVKVANKTEVAFIASKIKIELPNVKVSVKDDLRVLYENIYNLRSGFFLSVFIISFFTFFIIIYDKVSGLNSQQRHEIGVLKALGWRVGDVLNARLYEGVIISFISYVLGISIAFVYVYTLNAPYLKDIFLNNYDLISDFKIHFSIDYETLSLLFLLSVPIYIAATIIPSWRVATLDADEVMR